MKRIALLLCVVCLVGMLGACRDTGSASSDAPFLPAEAKIYQNGELLETIIFHWEENGCRFDTQMPVGIDDAPAIGYVATFDPSANRVMYTIKNGIASVRMDAEGNRVYEYKDAVDALGYVFDDEGYIVTEIFDGGDVTTFTYNSDRTEITPRSDDEAPPVMTVDKSKRTLSYTLSERLFSFSFNERGDLTSLSDAVTLSYHYDARGSITKITLTNPDHVYVIEFTLSDLPTTHLWQKTPPLLLLGAERISHQYYLFAPICFAYGNR